MRYGVVIREPNCVPSIAMQMVNKPYGKFKITDCIYCLIFGKYLITIDVYDIHCNYYRHLTSNPTRHYYQTRFSPNDATPLRLAVDIKPCLFCYDRMLQTIK